MYVIIEYKGKQYKAQKGDVLVVDNLDAEAGSKLDITTVMLVSEGNKDDGSAVKVGTPYISGAKVVATVESDFRTKKILVLKYKSKKDYHRTIGFRAMKTKIKIDDIIIG